MIGPKDGGCSAAAYFGDTTIVSDISSSPLWENCRDLALRHNIKSSISIPIFSGKGQILGTVSMFFQIPYEPNSTDINILKVAIKLSAIAIEKHKLINQLIHHSQYDPLTKLPNRKFLKDHLMLGISHALRYNEEIGILHINLDRFKYVNDSIGHQIGDLLLKQVAERIMSFTRESDTLSHIGGDEFVLILNDTDKQGITKVASRILASLIASFQLRDYEFHISASIGISVFPDDGQDVETLQKNASIAMYYSKNQGGNQFNYFTHEMNAETIRRFEIENELRKAIERGEFQLYYQSQFDLRKVEVIGFEALLRWNHSELGFISPEKFIPIAEESGIIVPIGTWVLQEACRQNVEWQNKGYGYFKVSVNVSTVQLMQDNFISAVEDALQKSGLPSQWIELEITESTLMKDIKSVAERLTKLQKLGVTIAIDDFGTGYSSMAYLKGLPINCLKIDKSFMIDIGTRVNSSHQAKALIQTFVSLSKNLGLKTVAEGVENQEQFKFLYEIGCDIGQGFFFNRPMPAQEITFLDKNWIF
jgi:diguanylate cyclase (GGDEF)-like protein